MIRLFILSSACAFLFANDCNSQLVNNKIPLGSPENAGFGSSFFPALTKNLNDSIPSLGSFLVWSHGSLVYEKYFHGATPETAFDIKSITKSVVSAMAGIAIEKRKLPDLNTPVLTFFPEFSQPHATSSAVWFSGEKAREDSIRKTLRLKDLMAMQTGWEWSDFGPVVNVFINAADPVRFTMDLPFAESPGTRFTYCSAATSLFSAALTKSINQDLKDFAITNLFKPAGITWQRWDVDPVGRYIGASEMYLTPRDLLRFGSIYLYKGKINGKQVLSEEWIKKSTSEQAVLNYWDILPDANGYGYFWWRRKTNGHQAWIASGACGQLITIVPDLDMIVVTTCFLDGNNRGREELRRLHLFIEEVTKASR